jgi:hypothetical protein
VFYVLLLPRIFMQGILPGLMWILMISGWGGFGVWAISVGKSTPRSLRWLELLRDRDSEHPGEKKQSGAQDLE